MNTKITKPRILAYHLWGVLSTLFYWTINRPVSGVQWWLVEKQDAAYPPEDRARTMGGLQ